MTTVSMGELTMTSGVALTELCDKTGVKCEVTTSTILGPASLISDTAVSSTVLLTDGKVGTSSSIDKSIAPLAKSLSLRVMVDSTPCGILKIWDHYKNTKTYIL
jgi:hypothetical protein